MYAAIRTYSGEGASELFDAIDQRQGDVKELISGVPGFISYAALRTDSGGVTITVCHDKSGADESTLRAAGWVADNVSASVGPPAIVEGQTVLQFAS
jgi:hypothetical protein